MSCGENGEMMLNEGSRTPTVFLRGCLTGWGGGRGHVCGDEDRIPPRSTGIVSHLNQDRINSHHFTSTVGVAVDIPLGCVHKRLPRRRQPRSSAGKCYGGCCRRRRIHSALRLYPGELPFRTGWGTSREPPTACGDQRLQHRTASVRAQPQPTISPRLRLGRAQLEDEKGFWETHPASPPPTVYWLRSSGRRCCWWSGHRRVTWACSTWTPASWTFHSENTNVQNKFPSGILSEKIRVSSDSPH